MVRRGIHLFSPVLLVYYVLPQQLLPGFDKRMGVVLAAVFLAVVEGVRLLLHRNAPGMRDYERHRIAGYAWGGFGMALGFLFFPPVLHVVTFCGMAWIDPLCAWSRSNKMYPRVPMVTYFAGAMVFLAVLSPYHGALALRPYLAIPLAFIAAVAAVASEYPKWTFTDDDFVMNVAPLILLTVLVGF